MGILWCPLGCLGGSRAVRVTVGLRMLSGLLLGLFRLLGFRGRSPRRHPKTAKGKSGPCCLFCSCLSLGLSLGLPGRVSVHLALCRSVALCRFLPLCPAARKTLHIDVLPVPSSSRFPKCPWRSRGASFLTNYGPHFWPEGHHFWLEGRFARKTCMFFAGHFLV